MSDELLESVRDGGAMLRGEKKAARRPECGRFGSVRGYHNRSLHNWSA